MGVIVSILSFQIANEQRNYDKALAKPIINVLPIYTNDGYISGVNIENSSNSAITSITTTIAPYYRVTFDYVGYIVLRDDSKDEIETNGTYYLPISFFDTDRHFTAAKTGLLGSVSFENEIPMYLENIQSFKPFFSNNYPFTVNGCALCVVICIKYTDLWGNSYIEMFDVETGVEAFYGSKRTTRSLGVHAFYFGNSKPDLDLWVNLSMGNAEQGSSISTYVVRTKPDDGLPASESSNKEQYERFIFLLNDAFEKYFSAQILDERTSN